MVEGGRHESRQRVGPDTGSVLLVVLLLALGAAALVAGAGLTIRAGWATFDGESSGREGLAAVDGELCGLAQQAWRDWGPLERGGEGEWRGSLAELPHEPGMMLSALVRPPDAVGEGTHGRTWHYATGAVVEGGRDGVDLPHAALVADGLRAAPGRVSPVVSSESTVTAVAAYAHMPVDAALFDTGIILAGLVEPWRPDRGTLALAVQESLREGGQVIALTDRSVGWHRLPASSAGAGPEEPVLVVVSGGAGLDLSGLGDLFGAVVVDDAGLRLDGTRVHGAVMVTGMVDAGSEGQVLWSSSVYRWATDRSLRRVRLVPGTRTETLLP